ncbi:MAG TPA: quinone-dependent dihydroorotate dehydrogenase [Ignavibacteria bacterium]|nr:quinone-dependent dihydroorotate dehydrogenase [Ignavibacteria bacterium]
MYKLLIRPIFFLFDSEKIHNFTLFIISRFTFLYPVFKLIYSPSKNCSLQIANCTFKSPLGLAAGFDKNGVALRFWDAVGFSYVEVGTVTPLGQPGNPKPRIFRLKKEKALINRLGFNNKGADEIRKNILEAKPKLKNGLVVGVNIGKNKHTSIINAVTDYKICFEKLFDAADYFTVNISSPNTKSLRDLHNKEYLDNLLAEIQNLNLQLAAKHGVHPKNIFLKISPDLESEEVEEVYDFVCKHNFTGIIATNTTVSRSNLGQKSDEQGGLSGKPLKPIADKILHMLNELNLKNQNKKLILIGVGGVFSKQDFEDKTKNGASLVQVYTGFIYEGPGIIKKILR